MLRRALAVPLALAVPALGCVWLTQVLTVSHDVPAAPLEAMLMPAPVAAPAVVATQPQTTTSTTTTSTTTTSTTPTADQVSRDWVSTIAESSGISPVAVAAYADAVLTRPAGCQLGWTTLAGIGWVESQQGTIGGRTLEADARPSSPILGPALDGVGYAAVPASGTDLTGDARWDHAVGPLQFLPSTWATWGRDGDGDGIADPQDLDDAAAAAAAYLCGTGQDLAGGTGWSAAIFAYNHSDAYVRQVYDAASTYAARTS